MRCSALAVLALLVVSADAAGAQKKDEPRRPRLPAGADTNSARAYYDFGLTKIEREPDQAADAFYWAIRISPTFAEAYYARRCALLLTDKQRFRKYEEDDGSTIRSVEIRRIDSLYYQSLMINPFMYPGLEALLFRGYVDAVNDEYLRRDNLSPSEVQFQISRLMQSAPPSFKAWRAYAEGRFADALVLYEQAIKDAKYKAELRADRGRVFFQLGEVDSAVSELTESLDELRKADKKDIVYVYESKALLEHSIGLLQARLGNKPAAREAFGRALEEDLSYSPAHMQLAYLAIDANDTTTALSEMALAVQIRGEDPALRYIYGYALGANGRYEDAEVQLRNAIVVDPLFAAPYHALGQVLDALGRSNEALVQFQSFLAHASQTDPRRKEVEQRVREMAVKHD